MNDLVTILKGIADENRLKILKLLSQQEYCVYEIMDKMGMSQSTTSHHLKILKTCGLVKFRKVGKWIFYSINAVEVRKFQSEVNEVLASLDQEIEPRQDTCEHCEEMELSKLEQ